MLTDTNFNDYKWSEFYNLVTVLTKAPELLSFNYLKQITSDFALLTIFVQRKIESLLDELCKPLFALS